MKLLDRYEEVKNFVSVEGYTDWCKSLCTYEVQYFEKICKVEFLFRAPECVNAYGRRDPLFKGMICALKERYSKDWGSFIINEENPFLKSVKKQQKP